MLDFSRVQNIRANGVEAEFPLDTDIGILAAFVKALGHA